MRGQQVRSSENQTSQEPQRGGKEKALQPKADSREPPTPPLGEEGAETPLGAEEEARRRGGGEANPAHSAPSPERPRKPEAGAQGE